MRPFLSGQKLALGSDSWRALGWQFQTKLHASQISQDL
jgi:hypothetical protein